MFFIFLKILKILKHFLKKNFFLKIDFLIDFLNFIQYYIYSRFFFVSHQIDRVARRLEELNITRVVILDYYDVTRNEKGVVDGSCGAFGQAWLF